MTKITFIGDIMCDSILIKRSMLAKDEYNFDGVFKNLKPLFDKSDYVVANLETVVAGKELRYSSGSASFNAPESILHSLKSNGVDAVTIANNHILDRKDVGLIKTIEMLKKYDIDYTGAYIKGEADARILYKNINGVKISILAYTDGTGYGRNRYKLTNNNVVLNVLKPYGNYSHGRSKGFRSKIIRTISTLLGPDLYLSLYSSIARGGSAFTDKCSDVDECPEIMKKLKDDIEEAGRYSDYVFMCVHFGGQYNLLPGPYVKKIAELFTDFGVNAIVGTHPHIIQEISYIQDKVTCAFSLGSLNMSPDNKLIIWDNLPDYSIALHYYFDNGSYEKSSFSILKTVRDKSSYITVYPVDVLFSIMSSNEKNELINDCTRIYNTCTKRNIDVVDIMGEYF